MVIYLFTIPGIETFCLQAIINTKGDKSYNFDTKDTLAYQLTINHCTTKFEAIYAVCLLNVLQGIKKSSWHANYELESLLGTTISLNTAFCTEKLSLIKSVYDIYP